jgi:hypothetical protein
MIDWLSHAFSTYVLHVQHGAGYQWWSGTGSDLTYFAVLCAFWHRHNCHEPRCLRVVRHGQTHCPRHRKEDQ